MIRLLVVDRKTNKVFWKEHHKTMADVKKAVEELKIESYDTNYFDFVIVE
jgi:hypothetical protein